MPITSQEFRSQHKILFEAPIVPHAQVSIEHDGTQTTWSVNDLVDLNGNGQADYAPLTRGGGFFGHSSQTSTTEPNFASDYKDGIGLSPYTQIKAFANETGQEIVVPEDFTAGAPTFETRHYTIKHRPVQDGGARQSITDWVNTFTTTMQGAVGARWAIDCNKNTFVIYQ